MSSISPYASGGPAHYTSLGPSNTPGGFSGQSFGTPGLPNGFGFPSYGDPLFYFMPAASSFFINRLLGFSNGSAVNINVGPTPSHLGMGDLLLGLPFYRDSGAPSMPGFDNPNGTGFTNPAAGWGTNTGTQGNPANTPFYQTNPSFQFSGSGNPGYYFGQNPDAWYGGTQNGVNGQGLSTPITPWSSTLQNPLNASGNPSGSTTSPNVPNFIGLLMASLLGQNHHSGSILNNNPHSSGSGAAPTTVGTNVTTGGTGQVWGDPHFVDLENTGEKFTINYDVMGEGGKTYVILSDKSLQLNGEFKEAHRSGDDVVTVMGKVGLKLTDDQGKEIRLVMDADGGSPLLGDKALADGESHQYKMNGQDATVAFQNNKLTVSTQEYDFSFDKGAWQYGNYLNYEAKVKEGIMADGVNPHGLLGQTADFDGKERMGKRGAGAQGEGAIDLKVTDYEVKDLFADSTNTVIDRYGTKTHNDDVVLVDGKKVYGTLKNEQNDLLMAINRDTEGRVLLNEKGEAAMVGVRRNTDEQGKTNLFLADGKTQINDHGQVIDKEGKVKEGNKDVVKPEVKSAAPNPQTEAKTETKKDEPAAAEKKA